MEVTDREGARLIQRSLSLGWPGPQEEGQILGEKKMSLCFAYIELEISGGPPSEDV